MYLALLTAAMTTAKHCQFGDQGSLANMYMETAEDGGIREASVPTVQATVPAHSAATQESERVTKAKDPKKVVAGQKGAAARKSKQEALLEQLRKAKECLRPTQTVDVSHAQERVKTTTTAVAVPAGTAGTAPENESTEQRAWIAYAALAGTAAIAVGAVVYAQKSAPPATKNTVSTNVRAKVAPVGTAGTAVEALGKTILDKQPDPFYMQ